MCEIQELLPKGITPGREKDQMVNENWFHKIIPFIDTVLASELFNILLKSQVFPWQERERERNHQNEEVIPLVIRNRSTVTIAEIHLPMGEWIIKITSGKQGCATLTSVCHRLVEFLERQQFGFITVVHDCTHLFGVWILQPPKKGKLNSLLLPSCAKKQKTAAARAVNRYQ